VIISGPGRHRGFTVIEILSVLAIVSALATIAIPSVQSAIEHAKVARAIGDIRALEVDLDGLDSLPASLADIGRGSLRDPWNNPYQYLPFPVGGHGHGAPAGARRDRFLVPINTRYDLYSLGKDGETSASLTAGVSLDDVVRAADGGYIGPASKF